MNKKLKMFNYLKWVVDILFLVVLYFPIFMFIESIGGSVFETSNGDFVTYMLIVVLVGLAIYYLLNLFSIIWHELGHLLFGLKAKFEFIAFNVLSFNFTVKDGKLSVKKECKLPGNVLGYCNMTLSDDKKADKKSIIMYFMGGITFNIIAALVSFILFLVIKNEVIDSIILLNLVLNIYYAIHNSIPLVLKSGNPTDALHCLYSLEDDTYFSSVSKIQLVNKMIANGVALEDIDDDLFVKPKNIDSKSNVMAAQLYMDYLVAHDKYKECASFIEEVLEKGSELLTKQDASLIKFQLLNCYFELNRIEDIKEYWNEDDTKFLEFISKLAPTFIVFGYMYFELVEKDKDNSKKYLDMFNKIDKKKIDEKTYKELEEIMDKINKSIS